jgi:uncharacterized protein involved in exopolysaccharide biosynthesis
MTAELLSIAFKHKFTITTIALVAALAAYFVTAGIPKSYQSHSVILIKPGRQYVYKPELGDSRGMSRFQSAEIINTEAQVLNSRDLKEGLIERIGIERLYPSLFAEKTQSSEWLQQVKALFAKFEPTTDTTSEPAPVVTPFEKGLRALEEKDLAIKTVKDSNIIHLYLRNERPEIAAEALDTLVDSYIDKHVQIHADVRLPLMEKNLQQYKTDLHVAEANVERYKQNFEVYDLEEEIRLKLEQRTALDNTLKDTHNRIREVGEQVSTLRREMSQVPQTVPLYADNGTAHLQAARDRLLELQLKEQQLLAKYAPTSRLVADVRRELKSVQDFLQKADEKQAPTVRTGPNAVYRDMELQLYRRKTELSALQAKRDENELQLAQAAAALPELMVRQKELRGLQREVVAKERIYNAYLERLDHVRVTTSLDRERVTSVKIVQQASVPSRSLGLRRLYKVAIAGVLGVFAGLGIAFLLEYRRGVFLTSEGAQWQLKLPVLANVGEAV